MTTLPLGLRIFRYILLIVLLCAAIVLEVVFQGPRLLRAYVQSGMGSCGQTPIFCMAPQDSIIKPNLDGLQSSVRLFPHAFTKLTAYLPQGFDVYQETVKKVYYRQKKRPNTAPTVYVLRQDKDFFINAYPQTKKAGITDDYEFMRRVMSARLPTINNLSDAFFVITKGIFTPDIGDQTKTKMIEFAVGDKRGFLNYTLESARNHFDASIFDAKGNFFKLYIKDRAKQLSLNDVFIIIARLEAR